MGHGGLGERVLVLALFAMKANCHACTVFKVLCQWVYMIM